MSHLSKMLPACGFAIAVALVGVTSAFKDAPKTNLDDTYTFEYTGPQTPSATDVQDESNWTFSDASISCGGTQVACSVTVPSEYVTPVDPSDPTQGYTLDSDANIQAAENSSQVAHVTDVANGAGSYSNKN